MQRPRIAALTDCENRLRHDWQAFAEVWQASADQWRDQRRLQFEKEFLAELPGALSRASGELDHFRQTLLEAVHALEDPEVAR